MREYVSSPLYPASTTPTVPPPPPRQDSPSLWQGLEPSRQQQLAQCLAQLLQRLHRLTLISTQESPHDPL